MRCIVLQPFPCSFNGITSVALDIGDEMEFGDMAPGLIASGLVAPTLAAVEHPADGMPSSPLTGDGSGESLPPIDAYPHLSPAQEQALDRIPDDGKTKPGGAPKGGNRRKKA